MQRGDRGFPLGVAAPLAGDLWDLTDAMGGLNVGRNRRKEREERKREKKRVLTTGMLSEMKERKERRRPECGLSCQGKVKGALDKGR